jgi:NAD(P)-dependent dehydrogenase (short-subunit alcohol dehydrogenase family)
MPGSQSNSDLPAKITIITGGSRGLGRNTVLSVARKGGDVILTYHSCQGEAEAAVAEIEAGGPNPG